MKPRNDAESAFDGFKPPEYTTVPNALLDDLMCLMECSELKVTLAICRQTFGWHKKEDELSLSQLRVLTGLSRQGVITGIEDGMKRGVIRRRPKGQGYMYRIHLVQSLDQLGTASGTDPQKEAQLVQSLDQASPTIRPADPRASPTIRPELVHSLDTQKKGKKESESPPPALPAISLNGGGGDSYETEVRALLGGYNILGAAKVATQYAALDTRPPLEAIRAAVLSMVNPSEPNTENRIYRRLMSSPPPWPDVRAVAKSAPLVATRPNIPENIIAPAELARQVRERR